MFITKLMNPFLLIMLEHESQLHDNSYKDDTAPIYLDVHHHKEGLYSWVQLNFYGPTQKHFVYPLERLEGIGSVSWLWC